MAQFTVYLYQTADGIRVVENHLENLQRSQAAASASIETSLRMLAEFGSDPTVQRFKRLRHVEGGAEVWEARVSVRPGFRILFSPVLDEDAFIVLSIVRKDEFARNSKKYIDQALSRMDHWWNEVRDGNERY